ncbi:hypothetical protein [Rossellomorea aquimaris]|jgi:hypothetical protein|uniref:hypothetical protein n=1 Tax=Rossellomorea aquimaris TaxID=189382 RepID=UPI000A733345|nr:hypothetical protein [Rossellomorea aquimaris]
MPKGPAHHAAAEEFDFFKLLLVLLVVAFLITLGVAPIAALIIGIALLLILAISALF